MYKIQYFVILLIVLSPVISFASDINIIGNIQSYRDAGMMWARLVTNDGSVVELGAPGNMTNDARNCIYEAEEKNLQVNISAILTNNRIDENSIRCNTIINTNLYGPKIFGLQLGMSRDSVLNTMKKLASDNNNYYITEGKSSITLRIKTDKGYLIDTSFDIDNDNNLQTYIIQRSFFKLDSLLTDTFINKISKMCNISRWDYDKSKFGSEYVYKANNYKVTIMSSGLFVTKKI